MRVCKTENLRGRARFVPRTLKTCKPLPSAKVTRSAAGEISDRCPCPASASRVATTRLVRSSQTAVDFRPPKNHQGGWIASPALVRNSGACANSCNSSRSGSNLYECPVSTIKKHPSGCQQTPESIDYPCPGETLGTRRQDLDPRRRLCDHRPVDLLQKPGILRSRRAPHLPHEPTKGVVETADLVLDVDPQPADLVAFPEVLDRPLGFVVEGPDVPPAMPCGSPPRPPGAGRPSAPAPECRGGAASPGRGRRASRSRP